MRKPFPGQQAGDTDNVAIGTHVQAGEQTLAFAGDLDLATAPGLVASFDDLLETHPDGIVLDLREVTFADSTAMAALIRCRRRAAWARCPLALDVGDGAIARLLDMTKLYRVFDVR